MPGIGETVAAEKGTTAVGQDGIVETQVVENDKDKTKDKTAPKAKKAKKEKKPKEDKVVLTRPPMEQLTKDFEDSLKEQEIDGKKLTKLGYKCGKIIYGLKQSGQKDFRVIAFKARKKSKSVNGKSRCIFYFGVDQATAKALVKAHPELKTSQFGKCSVQSATPVELTLDRSTYTEKFGKDLNKVSALMETLVTATVENKTEQFNELKAKQEAKTAAKAEKKEKKKKTSKDDEE